MTDLRDTPATHQAVADWLTKTLKNIRAMQPGHLHGRLIAEAHDLADRAHRQITLEGETYADPDRREDRRSTRR